MVIKKIVNYIGVASAIAFAMLPALFMIAPIFQVAEETSATTSVITVGEIMSLAVDGKIDIKLAPASTGSFAIGGANIIADGNFRGGYTLLMSSDNDPADMIAKDSSGNTIGTISNLADDNRGYGVTGNELPANTYGYFVSSCIADYYVSGDGNGDYYCQSHKVAANENSVFRPVPTVDKLIATTDGSETLHSTISYGTRVDFSIPTGVYENTITFTWVSNYAPTTTPAFYSVTSMQEMTPADCLSVRHPARVPGATLSYDTDGTHLNDYNYIPAVDLTDERDGKTYRIARDDEGCYMTTPLEITRESLEYNDVDTLDSTDTDLPDDVTFSVEDLLYTADITLVDEADQEYEFEMDSEIAKFENVYTDDENIDHTVENYFYSQKAAYLLTDTSTVIAGLDVRQSICPKGWKLAGNSNSTLYTGLHAVYFDDNDQSDAGWDYGVIYKNDDHFAEVNAINRTDRSLISCRLKM